MAVKELWVYLLAHNLIRLIMVQSAAMADCLPRELSFKHSLQLWLAWRQFADGLEEDLVDLLCLCSSEWATGPGGQSQERSNGGRNPTPY